MVRVRRIPLSKGKYAIVDEEDYERISQSKWSFSGRYAVRSVCKKYKKRTIYLQREILKPSVGVYVDHRNRNTLDNRRANLRLCSPAENARNRIGSKSPRFGNAKFKGVLRHSKNTHWEAFIWYGGRKRFLGCFSSERDAALMYDVAAQILFGDFARLNGV